MSKELPLSHSPQTLQVFIYYRIALSGLLMVMFFSNIAIEVLGAANRPLYAYVSLAYFISALITPFLFPIKSLNHSTKRINFLLLIDAAAQITLIHASNGMDSGLGYLLIITSAMTSMFTRGRLAYAHASAVTIAIILDNMLLHLGEPEFARFVFSSGILGILIFATTIAIQYLTQRIRKSSEEAEIQSRQAKNLQEIAQNIVTRMQTGVIVIDKKLNIELMNASAQQMLNQTDDSKFYNKNLRNILELSPIIQQLDNNKKQGEARVFRTHLGRELRLNIAYLETHEHTKRILYLEDYSSIKQQAQEIKLASLGRLAARIAHEIRNPLGALSHATQLLAESEERNSSDARMIEIMMNNCKRVNDIIENTLAISRRKEPRFNELDLSSWLNHYIGEAHPHNENDIKLVIDDSPLLTKFDETHLQQVLGNLISNGLRYSKEKHGQAWVEILAGISPHDERPFIEIRDNGEGIPQANLGEIYEPFFTTNSKGSGLGLYICKELVEINHATLHYKRIENTQTCFRIDFSHHQRML